MKFQSGLIDKVQIVGIVVSTAISIVLIFVQVDPVLSVLLGLVVAVLIQLIDLQVRHSNSEERLLQANILSQVLYRDEWLLKQIQQIVNDYYLVKGGWFELFKRRADDSINECYNVLHSMVEGRMEVPSRSPFTFAYEGLRDARRSIKGVTDNVPYWRSIEAEKYLQVNAEVIRRGVKFIRVFVQTRENMREILDILEKHKSMGVEVYVAFSEELPNDLNENYIIMDDRIVTHLERIKDGRAREKTISTNPVEVERMAKRFDMVMRYARKLDDIIDSLKKAPPS